jgi:hypothetical protein
MTVSFVHKHFGKLQVFGNEVPENFNKFACFFAHIEKALKMSEVRVVKPVHIHSPLLNSVGKQLLIVPTGTAILRFL